MQKKHFFTLFVMLFMSILALGAEELVAEKELSFSFKDGASDRIEFNLHHPGDRLFGIEVHFDDMDNPDASLHLEGFCEVGIESTRWQSNFSQYLFAHNGSVSVVDNIAPMPGIFKFALTGSSLPVSGRLKLVDFGAVPTIKYDEITGAIKIRKPGNCSFVANGVYTEHPDFPGLYQEFPGSFDTKGDFIIPVPAGLFSINQKGSKFTNIESHLIPVHAGKMTVVDGWFQPPEIVADIDSKEEQADTVSELRIRSFEPLKDEQIKLRFATPSWQGIINKEELEISEGGATAEVLSVTNVATPLNLTILLDSSGSMRGDMKVALAAVEKFIKLLPENSTISLVDFDTKPKPIKAKSRNDLYKAIKAIKADGATCLYDSVMVGLNNVSNQGRSAILLFTDGFDANYNDTAPGSKIAPEDMFAAVKKSQAPIFTIGFGKKPDEVTLRRLASLTGGSYSKADSANLNQIFAKIASILSREHEMLYKRPEVSGKNTGVAVSIVLDVSGSMDSPPENAGCDYRMEKAKAILRKMIFALPDDAIAQITTYSSEQSVNQAFTNNKISLISSLGKLSAGGGTTTLRTLEIASEMLKKVPVARKYLLFITDEGIEFGGHEMEYQAILGSIKDHGILMTWLGMVDEKSREPFDLAAKLCNGHAVVSTDFSAIQAAVDSLGKEIVNLVPEENPFVALTLNFNRHLDDGKRISLSGSKNLKMPEAKKKESVSVTGLRLSWQDMPDSLKRYSFDLSRKLYGKSSIRNDTVVNQRLPISLIRKNDAMQLTILEAVFMSRYRGIEQNCVALKLKFKNIMPEQDVAVMSYSESHPASFIGGSAKPLKIIKAIPPYVIPGVRNNFFMRLNDNITAPVSDLSWLAEAPLIVPADESLVIKPDEIIEGYLLFEYDSIEQINNASLDFYDSSYGHLQIPLIGTIKPANSLAETTKLPVTVSGNIAESFEIILSGYADEPVKGLDEELTLRVYNLQIISKIMSMLDLNPLERLSLLLPTRFGNLICYPSQRTKKLPFGWSKPVLFLPGSNNFLRQAYVLPKSLGALLKGILRVDVVDNEILLSAGDKAVKLAEPLIVGKGDNIDLLINAYNCEGAYVYFDLTLDDKKDGAGTRVLVSDLLQLKVGEEIFTAESLSDRYMFYPGDSVEVADGHKRRFLLRVYCPALESDKTVITLKSELFKINQTFGKSCPVKIDKYMLCKPDHLPEVIDRQERILELANQVHAARLAKGWKKQGNVVSAKKSLSGKNSDDENDLTIDGAILPPPDFKTITEKKLTTVLRLSEADFLEFLRKFPCIPGDENLTSAAYSPEAMLIQNWGTPADLFEFAFLYYNINGKHVKNEKLFAKLSDAGKEALAQHTGRKSKIEFLPILKKGKQKLVLPFCQEVEQIKDFVAEVCDYTYVSSRCSLGISIKLKVKSKASGQMGMMGSLGSALGGESEEEDVQLIPIFEQNNISFSSCSRAPIDVFYFSPDSGQKLYAIAEGAEGTIENMAKPFSLLDNEVVEELITITFPDETLNFSRKIASGTSILSTFRTLALCMPDLTAESAKAIALDFEQRRTKEAPGTRSTAKWFSRAKIYQFLAMQSAAEAEAAQKAGVEISRPGKRMRAIIATLCQEKDSIIAQLDLRQVNPVVVGEEKAVRTFNFFMGITNSLLEEKIMGGGGIFSRWLNNQEQKIVVVGPDEIGILLDGLNYDLVSEQTKKLLEDAQEKWQGLIFPLYAPVDGEKALLAWFRFNPDTYEMVSVLDNGAHGSMVEKPILDVIQDATKYSIGFFIGINSSIWATSLYSLNLEDHKEIMKAAKSLCLGMAGNFGNIGKTLKDFEQYTVHEAAPSAGPVQLKTGFGQINKDGFKLVTKPSLSFNFTYQSGFKDSLKAYFAVF